jgi:hypothetical protein
MQYQKVIQKSPTDLIWPFKGEPYIIVNKIADTYNRNVQVDPFPCGVHDKRLVEKFVGRIEQIFPTNAILQWAIIPFETCERTNAWAQSDSIWSAEASIKQKHKIDCLIVLSGKRPIVHPAMTEYLVAHEYGHIVDYWITACMKEETGEREEDVFRKKYAEVRGIEYQSTYGGGRWVDNIMEVIADDFRIIMGKTDPDFYLHSCTHPLSEPRIINYWNELYDKYAIKV